VSWRAACSRLICAGMKIERIVLPERLDVMSADDPVARRSRGDLRRVHRALRTLTILRRAVGKLRLAGPPRSILELGAGDGSLMLRFARSMHTQWRNVEVTFLDRHDLIDRPTRRQFGFLGWDVRVLSTDVLDWARASSSPWYDLCVATLFLHHFQSAALEEVLRSVAARCRAFVACEPRRNGFSWSGSHLLGLLGANEVTREDGVTSVRAGFAGEELSVLWPRSEEWQVREYFAWPFTHCLVVNGSSGPGRIADDAPRY
jgi:hypothetical protein